LQISAEVPYQLSSTEFWFFFFKWCDCFLFVIVSCSLTSRAEFPLAIATVDGFGGADLTISKLRSLCQKKQPKDWMVIFLSCNSNCLTCLLNRSNFWCCWVVSLVYYPVPEVCIGYPQETQRKEQTIHLLRIWSWQTKGMCL
jgi:hypothetical protein